VVLVRNRSTPVALAPNRKLPGFDGYYKGLVNMKCYVCSAEYAQQTGSYEFKSKIAGTILVPDIS
jgi:hypothetical protein